MAGDRIIAELLFEYQQFRTGMGKVFSDLTTLDQKGSESFARFADNAKDAFNAMAASVKNISLDNVEQRLASISKTLKGALSETIGIGGDFQETLLKIQATGDLTDASMGGLREQLRGVGEQLGIGVKPINAAAGQLEIMSSGFESAADSSKVLVPLLKLTADGTTETGQAARTLAGFLNAYGLSADQAATVTDKLFATTRVGVTTVSELSASLGQVAPTAAQAGVSVDELFAAIAAATLSGQTTSTAIVGVRGTINSLVNPTDDAKKALAQYGLTVDANTVKQKGLRATLLEIQKATGGNAEAFQRIIGTQEATATASALLAKNGQLFGDALTAIGHSAGEADKFVSTLGKGFNANSREFAAAMEVLKEGVANELLPAFTSVTKAGTQFLQFLDHTPGPIKTAAAVLVGLTFAATSLGAALLAARATVPVLAAELSALGARAVPICTAAVTLLNTELTLTGVAGGVARAGLAVLTAPVTLLTGLVGALDVGLAAVAGTIGVVATALAVVGAAVLAVGAGMVYLEQTSAAAAEEALKVGDIQAQGRDVQENISTRDILSLSAAELKKRGITKDTITQRILDEQNAADQVDDINKEAAQRALQRAHDLKQKRAELAAEEAKPAEDVSNAALQKTKEQVAAEKKAREEAFKDDLQRIELSNADHKTKIAQLEELRSKYQLTGEENRQINQKVYDELKAQQKSVSDAAKKKHDEEFKQSLQEVDNSKKGIEEQIAGYKKLLENAKLSGDERRQIEDKLYEHEAKLNKQREEDAKRLRDAKTKAAEGRVADSEQRTRELEEKSGRGADTSQARADEVKLRGQAQVDSINAQLTQDLSETTDSSVQKALRQNAQTEKLRVERETNSQLREIEKDRANESLQREQDLVGAQKRLSDQKLAQLQQQAAQGKVTESALRQFEQERFAVLEREIQLQAQLAAMQTDDPRRLAQIEAEAQGQIRKAREDANAELQKGLDLMQEQQKQAKASAQEFSGRVLSVSEFVDQQNKSGFDSDTVRGSKDKPLFSDFQTQEKKNFLKDAYGNPINTALNKDVFERNDLSPSKLKGQGFAGGTLKLDTDIHLDLTLREPGGKKIDFERNSQTINGKNSDQATQAGRMGRGGP